MDLYSILFYSVHLYSAFSIVKDQMTLFRHRKIEHEIIRDKRCYTSVSSVYS